MGNRIEEKITALRSEIEDIKKQFGLKRPTISDELRQRISEAFSESKISCEEFAKNIGISPSCVQRCVKRSGAGKKVSQKQNKRKMRRLIIEERGLASEKEIIIELPNGIKIKGLLLEDIQTLLTS